MLNTQLSPCLRLRCAQTLPQTALCVWVLCVWVLWGNRLPRPISSLVRVPHFGQSARRGQATCAAQCGSCCCANCRHADPAAQELAHGQGPHMCVCSVCVRECLRRQGAGCSRLQVPANFLPQPAEPCLTQGSASRACVPMRLCWVQHGEAGQALPAESRAGDHVLRAADQDSLDRLGAQKEREREKERQRQRQRQRQEAGMAERAASCDTNSQEHEHASLQARAHAGHGDAGGEQHMRAPVPAPATPPAETAQERERQRQILARIIGGDAHGTPPGSRGTTGGQHVLFLGGHSPAAPVRAAPNHAAQVGVGGMQEPAAPSGAERTRFRRVGSAPGAPTPSWGRSLHGVVLARVLCDMLPSCRLPRLLFRRTLQPAQALNCSVTVSVTSSAFSCPTSKATDAVTLPRAVCSRYPALALSHARALGSRRASG